MAKQYGGTRKSTPARPKGFRTPLSAGMSELVKALEQDPTGDSFSTQNASTFDKMTLLQKQQALEQAKVTAMVSENSFYDQIGYEAYKQVPNVKEVLDWVNHSTYENHPADMEDENHYVIKYKGKAPLFTADLTDKKKFGKTGVEWVSGSGGLAMPYYWAKNDKAKAEMKTFMGFVEYKNGKKQ